MAEEVAAVAKGVDIQLPESEHSRLAAGDELEVVLEDNSLESDIINGSVSALDRIPSTREILAKFRVYLFKANDSKGKWMRALLCCELALIPILLMYARSTELLSLYYSFFHHLFNTFGTFIILLEPFLWSLKPNLKFPYGYSRIDIILSFGAGLFLTFSSLFVFLHAFIRILTENSGTIQPSATPFFLLFLVNILGNFILRSSFSSDSGVFYKTASLILGLSTPEFNRIMKARGEKGDSDNNSMILLHVCTNIEILFNGAVFLITLYSGALLGLTKESYYYFDVFLSLSYVFLSIGIISSICTAAMFVLIHATPRHLKEPLEKSMREITTSEKIIEVTESHYWSLTSRYYVGSLNLRAQKSANEQNVLRRVGNTFMPLLHSVTVQLEKDDWNI